MWDTWSRNHGDLHISFSRHKTLTMPPSQFSSNRPFGAFAQLIKIWLTSPLRHGLCTANLIWSKCSNTSMYSHVTHVSYLKSVSRQENILILVDALGNRRKLWKQKCMQFLEIFNMEWDSTTLMSTNEQGALFKLLAKAMWQNIE